MPPSSETYASQDLQPGAHRREHWPRISKEKTKGMQANNKQQDKIKLNGEDLEDAERFTNLGIAVTAELRRI